MLLIISAIALLHHLLDYFYLISSKSPRLQTIAWFQILCINLKRFRLDFTFTSKISSHVSFPLDNLDMSPYLHKGQSVGLMAIVSQINSRSVEYKLNTMEVSPLSVNLFNNFVNIIVNNSVIQLITQFISQLFGRLTN